METSSGNWYKDNDLNTENLMTTGLQRYNSLLTYVRWPTKGTKGAQILDLVGVVKKFMEENKNPMEGSDRNNKW